MKIYLHFLFTIDIKSQSIVKINKSIDKASFYKKIFDAQCLMFEKSTQLNKESKSIICYV